MLYRMGSGSRSASAGSGRVWKGVRGTRGREEGDSTGAGMASSNGQGRWARSLMRLMARAK
jgi:hypothetical protein